MQSGWEQTELAWDLTWRLLWAAAGRVFAEGVCSAVLSAEHVCCCRVLQAENKAAAVGLPLVAAKVLVGSLGCLVDTPDPTVSQKHRHMFSPQLGR